MASREQDFERRNAEREVEEGMSDTKQNPRRPGIIGLSHMTFQASDVEKALACSRDILGYEDQLRLKEPDGRASQAFVRINDVQWIEHRPESAARTDRLIQFGLQVDDAEAMRVYLASRGAAVPSSTSLGAIGNLGFHVKDPDGHTVEFVQCLPEGWPARAAGQSPGTGVLSHCLMHIGFDGSSLEKSMAFYRDTLECAESWRGSSDEPPTLDRAGGALGPRGDGGGEQANGKPLSRPRAEAAHPPRFITTRSQPEESPEGLPGFSIITDAQRTEPTASLALRTFSYRT